MVAPPASLILLATLCTSAAASGALGIDVGSTNSVVAVARRGGVDVMANEATRRQTPSVVAFDDVRRFMGESALPLRTSRPHSSVAACKALLGRSLEQAEAVRPAPGPRLAADGATGGVVLEVDHLGGKRTFSPVQLLAMLLHHLRCVAEHEHGEALPECALAVPAHFGLAQRQAALDAVEVAGLRCVRLISEGAAAALDYLFGRRAELSATDDRHVAFVDAGASGVQVCVARIRRDELQVLSHAHAAGAGGAALDDALAAHFGARFAQRNGGGHDVLAAGSGSARPAVRLRGACEKLRRTLSANRESAISLDCLVGEHDLHDRLTRAELEEHAAPLLVRVGEACRRALRDAGLSGGLSGGGGSGGGSGGSGGGLHSVEMVGGFSRMPAVQAAVQEAFGGGGVSGGDAAAGAAGGAAGGAGGAAGVPRRTLNAEEAVARGAAYAAALHSKSFKVKSVTIVDEKVKGVDLKQLGEPGGIGLPSQVVASLRAEEELMRTADARLEAALQARNELQP